MTRTRCTGALLLWCSVFGLLVAILLRYGLLPMASEDGGYLLGIYARASKNLFYQGMIVVALGCLAYCAALLLTLNSWIRASDMGGEPSRFPAALVGLGRSGPLTSDWHTEGPVVLQLAANPVRDAAVVFPAVGFIGTVVGVSLAIGGLEEVMETQETGPLLDGLRIAFDTTFLGLLASVLLTASLYLIQSRMIMLRAMSGLARYGTT